MRKKHTLKKINEETFVSGFVDADYTTLECFTRNLSSWE